MACPRARMVSIASRAVRKAKSANRKNPKAMEASMEPHSLLPWQLGAPQSAASAVDPANQKTVVMARRTSDASL